MENLFANSRPVVADLKLNGSLHRIQEGILDLSHLLIKDSFGALTRQGLIPALQCKQTGRQTEQINGSRDIDNDPVYMVEPQHTIGDGISEAGWIHIRMNVLGRTDSSRRQNLAEQQAAMGTQQIYSFEPILREIDVILQTLFIL
jgi:hypothetical protein